MSNTKTVIELNGKRYDALTGNLLDLTNHPKVPAAQAKQAASSGENVDGFFRSNTDAPHLPVPKNAKKAITSRTVKQSVHAHKPQRTQTLMRHVVKKPSVTPKKAAASATKAPKSSIVLHDEQTKQREKRAQQFAKNPLISRFGDVAVPRTHKVKPQLTHVPVAPAPQHTIHTATVRSHAAAASHHAKPQHKAGKFATALEHASSHTQPKASKKRLHHRAAAKLGVSPRVINAGAASLAVLLIVGFVAYQNVPNFAMRIASGKAGFAASLPAYQPAGFTMNGPIQAAPGAVTINFRSTTDERNFSMKQERSNWTSQALLDNFVAVNNKSYQTFSDKGKTIYIYEGSNATWVNGGVWYQISGNSSLNSDQLLHIANSL